MTDLCVTLSGAQVLGPDGFHDQPVGLADGCFGVSDPGAPQVDLSGFLLLPGIVDIHGDGFERHVAPRRGALRDVNSGLVSLAAELAANGITTEVLAQFWSWEGGMRGPDAARRLLEGLRQMPATGTDLRVQLRLETHMIADYPQVEALIAQHAITYVVLNDHLPHAALAAGKRPPRLVGQALKSGRSPEAYLAAMQALHDQSADVPRAVSALIDRLRAAGVRVGSHDDPDAAARDTWRARGASISEFPETCAAARAARAGGDGIILGAPNVMRGASHAGNVSARDLVAEGLCDALASDYHYPAPRYAALALAGSQAELAATWRLVSSGPAQILGLSDRGQIRNGLRADLVALDPLTGQIGATIAAGRVTYMSGDVAARFLAA